MGESGKGRDQQRRKERKAVIDAKLEQLRAKEWRAYEQYNDKFRKLV